MRETRSKVMDAAVDPRGVRVGDHVTLRKPHPCGGSEWLVTRIGADIGLRCLGCGRKTLLDRGLFERRLKTFRPSAARSINPWNVSDDAVQPAVENAGGTANASAPAGSSSIDE